MVWTVSAGPLVSGSQVVFRLADATHGLESVRLFQEVSWPREGPELERVAAGFEVVFPRPPVNRMEYLFQLQHRQGGSSLVPDPANALRAPGPFGEKSVIEFPEYRTPDWTKVAVFPRGQVDQFEIPCPILGAAMPCRLWSSAGRQAAEPLPLLVALDGLEYDQYCGLTQMLDLMVTQGELPPMRAALLHPVRRDRDYAASIDFSRSLAEEVLPHLDGLVAVPDDKRQRVGMGASLGGLAMLFAQWSYPELLGGLFLQSASVFNHHYFAGDLDFEPMERICNFTERVHTAAGAPSPCAAVLTCGVVEETLLANTAMAASLQRLGYAASLQRLPDAHNWVAWRDAFQPHLVDLLRRLWL